MPKMPMMPGLEEGNPEPEAPEEGVEGEAPPEGEAAAPAPGIVSFDALVTQSEASAAEAATAKAQLEQLVEKAKENEATGADPAGIEALAGQVDDAIAKCDEYKEAVAAAAGSQNRQAATEAGINAQKCADVAKSLVSQAELLAEPTRPAEDDTDREAAAMALWSKRVMQGG
jgi:hypothetical protein